MQLNRDLKLISLALFLWAMGEGLFIFVLPIHLSRLGADAKQIGDIYSIGAVAMAVSLIPAGWASDRFGPKSGLVSGWVMGAVAGLFFCVAYNIPMFIMGWILYRATAWVLPPTNAYVTNARGTLTPERALSSVYSMYHAGLILSPIVGGYLAKHFDLHVNFYVATVVFMISTAVLLFLRPQPPHPTETHVSPVEILKNRKFVGFMGLVFGVMAVLYLGYEFAPKFLNEVKGIDVEQVGLLGSINALGGFTLGQLLGRRPPRLGVLISIGLVLIYGLVLLQASWVGWFILAYFLRGSYSAIRSLISALVTQLVPPKRLGVAFGAAEMVGTAADVVAPALAGRLYAISPPLPFGMMLALGSIALVVVGLFAPRPTAQPEPALASRPYD